MDGGGVPGAWTAPLPGQDIKQPGRNVTKPGADTQGVMHSSAYSVHFGSFYTCLDSTNYVSIYKYHKLTRPNVPN